MARHWTATFIVGLLVGVAGGLIGLGGAELRLPYLVGVLGLAAKRAVPVNLAVSLFTVLAALPVRLSVSGFSLLVEWSSVAGGLVIGAVVAAYLGAGWVRRISTATLSSLIAALLILLGLVMIAEAFVPLAPAGLFPAEPGTRFVIAVIFGFAIGVISSLLGVAGGEVIIPTLVVGCGVPVAAAGTLSLVHQPADHHRWSRSTLAGRRIRGPRPDPQCHPAPVRGRGDRRATRRSCCSVSALGFDQGVARRAPCLVCLEGLQAPRIGQSRESGVGERCLRRSLTPASIAASASDSICL